MGRNEHIETETVKPLEGSTRSLSNQDEIPHLNEDLVISKKKKRKTKTGCWIIFLVALGILAFNFYANSTRGLIKTFKSSDVAYCAAFSPDGQYIVSGGSSDLRLWDVETGKEIRSFHGHEYEIYSVTFSPDGLYILSASKDGSAKIWEVSTGSLIVSFVEHGFWVQTADFSPDGLKALSCSLNGTLILWDVSTGNVINKFHQGDSAIFTPDGNHALVWSGGISPLVLLDLDTGEIVALTRYGVFQSVKISSDGKYVIAGEGLDIGSISLFDLSSGIELVRIRTKSWSATSVAVSPYGMYALSGGGLSSGNMALWDICTGKLLRNFPRQSRITDVEFSPNGDKALSVDSSGILKLWDIEPLI